MNRWWDGLEAERYWLELTDRHDLGADLRAPLTDDAGEPNWRYLLFQATTVGDTVFHYDKNAKAIVARSRVSGEFFEKNIVWGARGSYARKKSTIPHKRPGYRVPLEDYQELASPVSIEQVELKKFKLKRLLESLKTKYGSIYFPWDLPDKRPARPLQGYAFKLPSGVLKIFPQLNGKMNEAPTSNALSFQRRTFSKIKEYQASGHLKSKPKGQTRPKRTILNSLEQFCRDPEVKAWVLWNADFKCELCESQSFLDVNELPYLELHRVKRLADGGSDTIKNAVCLCPNCHWACHYAANREELKDQLYRTIRRLRRE